MLDCKVGDIKNGTKQHSEWKVIQSIFQCPSNWRETLGGKSHGAPPHDLMHENLTLNA